MQVRWSIAVVTGALLAGLIGCAASPPATNPPSAKAAPVAPPPPAAASTAQFAGPAPLAASPIGVFGQLAAASGPVATDTTTDNLRQVTFATEGNDFDPAVDPTGKWLAFASTRHRPTANLYLQRVNSSTVTQLTDDPADDVMPTFSPDGKKIAFCSNRGGTWDIYLIPVEGGGQPVQLTNDGADNIHPSFAPDGQHLVYCSRDAQSHQWELVVIDLAKPGAKRYIGPGLFPQWSPTQSKILFQRARERGSRLFSVWTLDYINGEGLRPTEIVASSNAACVTPTWSPDGKRLAFCTIVNPTGQVRPQQADIWVVNADGTGRANLTHSRNANTEPVWAADGSIYFTAVRTRAAVQSIWSLQPDRAILAAEPTPASAPGVAGEPVTTAAPTMAGEPATVSAPRMVREPASAAARPLSGSTGMAAEVGAAR